MVEWVSGIWKGQKWDCRGVNGGEEAEWLAATLAKLACKQRVDCEGSALLCVSWEALDTSFGAWNHGLLEQRCKEKDSQPSQQSLWEPRRRREDYTGLIFCDGICECLTPGRPAAPPSTYMAGVTTYGRQGQGLLKSSPTLPASHSPWSKENCSELGVPDRLAASLCIALLSPRTLALASPTSPPRKASMEKSFALHRCVQ